MSPSDYEGLHLRYASILDEQPELLSLARPDDETPKRLSSLFEGMMRSLFKEQGAQFRDELVADPAVQEFICAHASVLDSAFEKVEMSDAMRRRLQRSDWVFSGMKAFHELNEAFPSLLDENGNRKSFERFLNDVQKIDKTYNANYLRAEYNFVAGSAEMAARWDSFMEDGDRYYLQYRTQRDDRVRPEHAALDRVTLPPSDSFWEEFYPPNGWNCRCTVTQVRKSKFQPTDHDEAMRLGDQALQRDSKGMFRFNPGIGQKSVPDYNPYTISRCRDCDIAKGNLNLARLTLLDNEVCKACRIIRECSQAREYSLDPLYGNRLRINNIADKNELKDNIRGAHAILSSFPDSSMTIRPHIIAEDVKNPEYTINGLIADRKGIVGEKGITSGFQKALKQNCQAVVIDLDMHMRDKPLRTIKLAQYIDGRKRDFVQGMIKECYVIYHDRAVRITSWTSRSEITAILEKLRP